VKILICGGRKPDFDYGWFFNKLMDVLDKEARSILCSHITIISGCAKGVDTMAIDFANEFFYGLEMYPADWDTYGKKAGPMRNIQMLVEGKPDLVIAFPGGTGTAHMKKIARGAGVRVIEIE
jgi:hypothetical protein